MFVFEYCGLKTFIISLCSLLDICSIYNYPFSFLMLFVLFFLDLSRQFFNFINLKESFFYVCFKNFQYLILLCLLSPFSVTFFHLSCNSFCNLINWKLIVLIFSSFLIGAIEQLSDSTAYLHS